LQKFRRQYAEILILPLGCFKAWGTWAIWCKGVLPGCAVSKAGLLVAVGLRWVAGGGAAVVG